MSRASKVLATTLMFALLMGVGLAALATASSGKVYKFSNSNPNRRYCTESVIADTADNRAYTYSGTSTSGNCTTLSSVNAGWLGANAMGYRDGSFCNETGWYYSGVATHTFGAGAVLCSNPVGSQVFKTQAVSRGWDADLGAYDGGSGLFSPNQNY